MGLSNELEIMAMWYYVMVSLAIENTRFSINFSTPTHQTSCLPPYLSPNLYVINSVDGYLLNEGKNYNFMKVFDGFI